MKRGDTVLFQIVPAVGYWNIGILLAEIPDGYLICSAVSEHNGAKDYTNNVCIAKRIEAIDLEEEHAN